MAEVPEWFRQHELQDSQRHGELMGEMGIVNTNLTNIGERLDRFDAYRERISTVNDLPVKRTSQFPVNKATIGLIAAIGVLTTLITKLVDAILIATKLSP